MTDFNSWSVGLTQVTDGVSGKDIIASTPSDSKRVRVGTTANDLAAGNHTHAALIPAGGTTGQVLCKVSGTDYATAWQNAGGAGQAISGGGGTLSTSITTTDITQTTNSLKANGIDLAAGLFDADGSKVTIQIEGSVSNNSAANRTFSFQVRLGASYGAATIVQINSANTLTTANVATRSSPLTRALGITLELWRSGASSLRGTFSYQIEAGTTQIAAIGTLTEVTGLNFANALVVDARASVSATGTSVAINATAWALDRVGTTAGTGTASYQYTSLVAMRAANTTPAANAVAKLLGTTSPNDGGQAEYIWNSTSTAPDDGDTVVQITGVAVGRWNKLGVPRHNHLSPEPGNTLTSGPLFWAGSLAAFNALTARNFQTTFYIVGGSLYVSPTTGIDFTLGLPAGFTFARNSPQWIAGSNGVWSALSANAYGVHYAWNPATSQATALGYWAEQASSQKVALPIDLADSAAVDHLGLTYTANATAAPDGTTTADKFTETAANEQHSVKVRALIGFTQNKRVVYSVFIKKDTGGRDFYSIRLNSPNAPPWYSESVVDCSGATPVISGRNWGGATVKGYADGWWRYEISWYAETTDGVNMQELVITPLPTSDPTLTFAGDTGKSFFVWGAQIEGTIDGLVAGSSPMIAADRVASVLHGPISLTVPSTITVKGRAPGCYSSDLEDGVDDRGQVDQFFCAFTGPGAAGALIEVYRQYDDRKLIVSIVGGAKYDLGVVESGADFTLTTPLTGAPAVDHLYVGTDALLQNHWNGTIKEISLA